MLTDLSVRLTHRYRDGWSHLDESFSLGSAEVLPPSKQRRWNADGESFRQLLLVAVTSAARPANVIRALRSTFTHCGCRHDHDCCGCVFSAVTNVRPLGRSRYAVRISGGRNV